MALLLIPFFLVLMYVLVVLPQQRRVRAHHAVVASLATGQTVMTTSGVYGVVSEVGDEHVMLEVAHGVTIKVARASVGLVVPDGRPAGDAGELGAARPAGPGHTESGHTESGHTESGHTGPGHAGPRDAANSETLSGAPEPSGARHDVPPGGDANR